MKLLLSLLVFLMCALTMAPPSFSATSPMIEIQPGIYFYETQYQGVNGVPTKLWVYLPKNRKGDVPAVVIAPAGSRLFHGMKLGDGDRAEHYPYVQNGFAVVAYELSGPLEDDASDAEAVKAAREFKAAEAGLKNARSAIEYASRLTGIDANKIYAAGHSSAGTIALQVGEFDPRVKAVAAYAPAPNLVARMTPAIAMLEPQIPGFGVLIASHSPDAQVSKLHCPVLLFHADDDDNVKSADLKGFLAGAKLAKKDVRLVTVPTGGHFQSMIDSGIPAGIKFFKSLP